MKVILIRSYNRKRNNKYYIKKLNGTSILGYIIFANGSLVIGQRVKLQD